MRMKFLKEDQSFCLLDTNTKWTSLNLDIIILECEDLVEIKFLQVNYMMAFFNIRNYLKETLKIVERYHFRRYA